MTCQAAYVRYVCISIFGKVTYKAGNKNKPLISTSFFSLTCLYFAIITVFKITTEHWRPRHLCVCACTPLNYWFIVSLKEFDINGDLYRTEDKENKGLAGPPWWSRHKWQFAWKRRTILANYVPKLSIEQFSLSVKQKTRRKSQTLFSLSKFSAFSV